MKAIAPAVSVHSLTVVRGGTTALREVTFDLAPGTLTGLLGPSGSGKSTLLRSLVGVQIITSGRIEVLGLPAGDRALRSRVGYVTQQPSVYPDLTVRQNLTYFASILGAPTANVGRVIGEVDLGRRSDRMVSTLSGGERSRVSLAAALLGAPKFLVLDEPTVGLDPVLRQDLWQLFARLADDGVTILVSSHVMEEATRCQRLLLLRESKLLADASLAELRLQTGEQDPEQVFLSLIRNAAAPEAGGRP